MIEISRLIETGSISGGFPTVYVTSQRVQYGGARCSAMYLYGLQYRPRLVAKARVFDTRRARPNNRGHHNDHNFA